MQLWQAELQRWQTELAVHHTPKQQRTEEAAAVPDHPHVASGGANPPNWHRYYNFSRSTFQKLETQEQDRRAVPIDRGMLDHDLPRGGETEVGETRGWFSHWRRGVGPTRRGWANGSLGAVVHMLATSAQKFGVVDELGAELGFLPRAQGRCCRPAP